MADVKAWREGVPGEPTFPNTFDVVKKAVLQVTDIKTNRNKYYAIEIHAAQNKYRVYTHYGRTDDLETNPDAGARESRYFVSLADAQSQYDKIYREKTSTTKGYKELSLASAKIGSRKTFGQSSGNIDDATLQKLAEKNKPQEKTAAPTITLAPPIQDLVGYLYGEATNALTSAVNATITAKGIETPLGVLTIGQIEKGQAALDALVAAYGKEEAVADRKLTDPQRRVLHGDPAPVRALARSGGGSRPRHGRETEREAGNAPTDARHALRQRRRQRAAQSGDRAQVPGAELQHRSARHEEKFVEIKQYVESRLFARVAHGEERLAGGPSAGDRAFNDKVGSLPVVPRVGREELGGHPVAVGCCAPKIVVSLGVQRPTPGGSATGSTSAMRSAPRPGTRTPARGGPGSSRWQVWRWARARSTGRSPTASPSRRRASTVATAFAARSSRTTSMSFTTPGSNGSNTWCEIA